MGCLDFLDHIFSKLIPAYNNNNIFSIYYGKFNI